MQLLCVFNVINLFLVVKGFTHNAMNTWYPIAVTSELPSDAPQRIKVLGADLVIWKDANEDRFYCQENICSHRLAPLSEGRVDPLTNCIECPYHGWQFDNKGCNTLIPQAKEKKVGNTNTNTNINNYETKQVGNFLYAKLNVFDGNKEEIADITFDEPDKILNGLIPKIESVAMRELPYSFYYLLENFMDPAHIPFAHHGLQGKRDDACEIPMQMLENSNEKIEISFQDFVGGKARDGVVSFIPPCTYHYRTKKEDGTDLINLIILCVPVSPGRSRAFVALLPGKKKKFPHWLSHAFSNKFLDTDIWVHDQERFHEGYRNDFSNEKKKTPYKLMTSSDFGCISWQKWFDKHLKDLPAFGLNQYYDLKELTFNEKYGRDHHIKQCTSCSGALKNLNIIKQKILPLTIGILFILIKSKLPRIFLLSGGFLLNNFLSKTKKFITGPIEGDKTSAAQM